MIKQSDEIFHENVVSRKEKERERKGVEGACGQGFRDPLEICEMSLVLSAQERSFEKIGAFAARRGNKFKDHRLITPGENAVIFHHSPKKIVVFAAISELRSEWFRIAPQNFPPEEDVSCAGLLPG